MALSGIYKIQSKIKPERIYVGSAKYISKRKREHLCSLRQGNHGNIKLQRHYNKYGESDLIFSVIVGCEKENLLSYEQFYIDALNPYFNACKTAGSLLGFKWSEEAKKKQSLGHIGLQAGEKHPLYGKTFSLESREKMRVSHKGQVAWNKGFKGVYKTSEETKAKQRAACLRNGNKPPSCKGRKHSLESRLKMSEAQKGNKNCLGVHRSEETRRKMSEARKKREQLKKMIP